MNRVQLDAKEYVNKNTGYRYHYVKSDSAKFHPHYHNYYEFFMVRKGIAEHTVNGNHQLLCEGSLLFIRDFDYHKYKKSNDKYFEFINLAVSKEIINGVFDYLDNDLSKKLFLEPNLPPMTCLSPYEQEKFFQRICELSADNDIVSTRLKLKKFILDIFTDYFYESRIKIQNIPLWLELTYEKMKKPDNFIAGPEKMYEISGRSREHLSRTFKKYYNMTPVEFITTLRMQYSANLILNSNLTITDICYRCGYDNLSWFYKTFFDSFGVTPLQYRKKQNSSGFL